MEQKCHHEDQASKGINWGCEFLRFLHVILITILGNAESPAICDKQAFGWF